MPEATAAEIAQFEAMVTRDMAERPEEWMWLWRKVLRTPTGEPVPEDALRRFWGLEDA